MSDLALGQMPVAHQPLVAVVGQLVGVAARQGRHFGLDGLRQKRSRAVAQGLGQRVRKASVRGCAKVLGWESWKTLVSVWAYHSFSGEVEASNTPTIRRLIPSCRHQLSRLAPRWSAGSRMRQVMVHRDPSSPTPMPTILRYGIAVLSVAIAIGLDFFLLRYFEAILTPFLFAVAATVWYAGTRPGVLAIVLSVLSLNYFFLRPAFSFSPISFADLVYLTFCIFCALAVGWVSAVRRRAEQELRQAHEELEAKVVERTANLQRDEAYLAQAQKLTHTGSWAWDPRTEKVLYCSEEMFRIFGLDPRKSLPSRDNFRQQIHPEDRDWVKKRFEESLRERVDTLAEYRALLPDGTVRHISASGHPVLNEDGELIEFIGTATVVTERKRLEERLRVQHTVAQILAEAATIEEASPRILRAMGECLGWDVGALWRVDREAEALRCVELWHTASIEVPELERVSREFIFVPGVGLPGRVWSSLEPEYIPDVVPDENFPRGPIAEREGPHAAFGFPILLGGEVLGVIEFFSREIGQPDQELLNMLATIGSQIGQFIERRRAEEAFRKVQTELAHANRVATMGQLSASIAHEVKQPITAAVTYALAARRWLGAEPPNFREVDDALALIVKEGERAGEVVARIRALIRKVPARKDAVEINDAILEVIALTRAEAANNAVSVRTQLAEGLPRVQGDRVQLQQVVLNLIINAIEAMRDVGDGERELLISTRNEPDGVSVEVRDSGPGFAPAALDRVFEAFYSTKPSGVGLGLSICRSIIEAHNGRLWASANLPRGASFQFALPAIANTAS